MKIRKNKKGISLIVLVITIIVMIILAAAIIISISNSGIINRANEAVEKSNEAELKSLVTVAWSEAYFKVTEEKKDDAYYLKEVKAYLTANGVTEQDLADYTLTATANGASISKKEVQEEQGIWKVYNVCEIEEVGEYFYTTALVRVESIYRQPTLQEYKERYLVKEYMGLSDISDKGTLDDLIMAELGATTMEEVLAVYSQLSGNPNLTRDQLFYGLMFQVADLDAALVKCGYDPAAIEAEYNSLQQQQVPQEELTKTYTITFPDATTQTVSGAELTTYLNRYAITEAGSYEIRISDGTTTETFRITTTKLVPVDYEDDYYTYNWIFAGYNVWPKDKTLTEYPEFPTSVNGVNGVPIDRVDFSECKNVTKLPTIPNTVTQFMAANCSSLVTAPVIPSAVTNISGAFSGCNKLSGVLYINSVEIENCSAALVGVGYEGTGLTVVVPNASVRAKIISESGYDHQSNTKGITIVAALPEE